MRTARIREKGDAYYHVISRVVDRRFALTFEEKERFRKFMRKLSSFTGVNILTYSLLDNHFHILLHVPERRPVGDDDLIRRMRYIYDKQFTKNTDKYLKALRANKEDTAAEEFKAKYTYRMYDLSQFMKTLKQRFTQSYNRRHARKGTLWEERYKSLLVEGSQGALSAVGAYIDLNAVRVNIVKDPKDYRFCGYGEAVAGSSIAREGLTHIACTLNRAKVDWPAAARTYRQLLYTTGEAQGIDECGRSTRPGFSPAQVQAVLDSKGVLPLNELLRCKIRYFTNGAVVGCRMYVDEAIKRHGIFFRPERKTGASPMKGGIDLFTARRLRLNVITPPAAPSTG